VNLKNAEKKQESQEKESKLDTTRKRYIVLNDSWRKESVKPFSVKKNYLEYLALARRD